MTYHAKNLTLDNVANKIKVVLVDDSKVVLSIFERVLISSGIIEIVGTANSASEALILMDQVNPDIILLDINMPNLKGDELLKKNEDFHSKNKQIPFLALTANTQEKEVKNYVSTLREGAEAMKQKIGNFKII